MVRVLGSDAAGGHRAWGGGGGGEQRSPRRGLGWARDAADPRTQPVPGDRKRKFACRSLWFSPLRCKSQGLPLLGRGRFSAPKLFLLFLLFGERLGRGGQRREPLCPSAAGSARSADWGVPGSSPRRPRPGGRLSSPAAPPLRCLFPARPRFGEAFPRAPTVRARRAHCEHRGRSGIFTPASRPWFQLSPPFPRGGRPGSDQVLCLHPVLQESALGCLPGWQ